MSQEPMSADITPDDKLWALLAYALSPLVPVIILLMEDKKNRPFIRAHNAQALAWGLVNLVADPDKFEADEEGGEAAGAQREFRYRNIPSGLAKEIFLDVFVRPASFEPTVKNLDKRLFDAYAAEVARVDQNGDGIISAIEGDTDTASDGFDDNERLYIPATRFNRFAVTREINDGLIAPRFAPSQRAFVLQGHLVKVDPSVAASAGRDSNDR